MSSQKGGVNTVSIKLPPVNYRAKSTIETFQDNYNSSQLDLLFTRCLWYNLRREKCIVQFKKPSAVLFLRLSIPHNSLVHLPPSFHLAALFVTEKPLVLSVF